MNWLHDHGTDRLLSAVNATKIDTVSTPEYKAALAQQNGRDAKRAIGRGWTVMASNMAYDMVEAALAKPRPVERDNGDDGQLDPFDNAERRDR